MPDCGNCAVYVCRLGETERVPKNCPMEDYERVNTRKEFQDPEINRIVRAAALTESQGYMRWTRVEETMEFSRKMGFTKIGLAFCMGLRSEAKIMTKVLETNGFEVASIMCKTGGLAKEDMGLRDEDKVHPGSFEAACNPIAQAYQLNDAGTELNLIMGLCVGHDAVFTRFSKALVTTLIAKDRVLGHNPVAALYCSNMYYHDPLFKKHVQAQ